MEAEPSKVFLFHTMEISEIIRKAHLEQDEMLFVIGQYIKARKGVEVNTVIKGSNPGYIMLQLDLMEKAYETACVWFFKEGY